MACYTKENNTENVTASTGESTLENIVIPEDKWTPTGKISSSLMALFKDAAKENGLDWRWLAALSNAETGGWNESSRNTSGFHGIFQFKQIYMCSGMNSNSTRDQVYCAAKNMKSFFDTAKKYNFSDTDSYLYACIAHNCGVGGAQFLLDKASVKSISGMLEVERTLPASEFKYKFMSKREKRIEIVNHPYRCKKAYDYVALNYPN